MWCRTQNGWGFGPLDQVNRDNVGDLRLGLRGYRRVRGSPDASALVPSLRRSVLLLSVPVVSFGSRRAA